jgi:hypothetical protein
MDSVFEIRAFHSDNYVHVNQYMLKKIIVSYDHFPFDSCGVSEDVDLIISCKHPPVTVRYDSTVLGPTTCRSNALLSKDAQIFLLQYWWDATNYFCMGSQSAINLEDINVPGEYLYVEDVAVEGQGKRDLPGVLIVFHEWGACTDSTLLKISEAFQSKKMEVRIAPNPSAGNLNISVNSVTACSNTSVQLIDLLGKTVASKSVSLERGSNTIAWDVQYLPKGFYWIKFITGNGNSSVPVILQE